MKTRTIYVELLDEAVYVVRPVPAIQSGKNIYKILPTMNYDPEVEDWEFKPGTLVECEWKINKDDGKKYLKAIKSVSIHKE